MYLHLGQDTLVNTKEIVGVFDLDTSTVGKDTRVCLAEAEKAGRVVNVSMELPKSFVVTAGSATSRGRGSGKSLSLQAAQQKSRREVTKKSPPSGAVYISQLASATLKGRADDLFRSQFA